MSIKFTGDNGFSHNIDSQRLYSDGTPMVKTDAFEDIVANANTVTVRANSLLEFTTAMFLVDAVNWKGGHSGGIIDTLVLPYLPGARQDRINVEGDVLFTARSVASMINDRQFENVVVLDPHSQIMPSFISRVVEYPLERVYERLDAYTDYDGVIAPDKGGIYRAGTASASLEVPLIKGGKHRDVSTGLITGFTLNNLPTEGHYLVVDDICDGGGTFNGLASKIHEQGSTADLYVTHGIFSKGVAHMLGNYEKVVTTDSLPQRYAHNLTILPVVAEMEDYI